MAKGWESKSVEEQQSLAAQAPISEEERARLSQENREKVRKQQALQLNRVRVQQQLEKCGNDRYREMLQQELNFLDGELGKLS